jgi:alkylated DNA repair dioxygenase AlkB
MMRNGKKMILKIIFSVCDKLSQTTVLSMFNLGEELKNGILCQKRTGKNKKYVIMRQNLIIKGPYKKNNLDILLRRSQMCKEWNSPYIVHPNENILMSSNGDQFITFPNLAIDYPMEFISHVETFTGDYQRILIRNGLLKLGDEMMKLDWIVEHLPNIALSLLHLYILGVGDVGFYNILIDVNTKQIYIIDYEENRSKVEKDRNDDFFMFSKRPAKDKANLWLQHVKPMYSFLINEISKLLVNEEFKENVKAVVSRLSHLSGEIKSQESKVYLNDETGYILHYPKLIEKGSEIFNSLSTEIPWIEEEITMFGKTTKTGRYISVHGESNIEYKYAGRKVVANPWTPTLLQLKKIAENYAQVKYNFVFMNYYSDGMKKIGWHADDEKTIVPRSSITSISVGASRDFKIKSKEKGGLNLTINLDNGDLLIMGGALQENYKHSVPVRTKVLDPRINLTFRMMNVEQSSISNDSKGKMEFRGMFGGSKTFSGYTIDVVKSGLQKYIRRNIPIKALYSGFELYRMVEVDKGVAVQTNCYNRLAIIACEDIGPANLPLVIKVVKLVLDKNRDVAVLASMIQLMAGSEKTRMMSHLNRTYMTMEGKIYCRKIGFPVDDVMSEGINIYSKYWLESDPMGIRHLAEMFLLRLQERSFMAFDWLGQYKVATKDLKVKARKRRTDPMVIIWDMLASVLPYEVSDTLSKAYFKMTEKGPFLMTAVVVALYGTSYNDLDLNPTINVWREHGSLNQLMKGEYEFTLDDYVIDKHTLEGKMKGATRNTFVNEGAMVIPQSELYYIKQFEDIYINS